MPGRQQRHQQLAASLVGTAAAAKRTGEREQTGCGSKATPARFTQMWGLWAGAPAAGGTAVFAGAPAAGGTAVFAGSLIWAGAPLSWEFQPIRWQ